MTSFKALFLSSFFYCLIISSLFSNRILAQEYQNDSIDILVGIPEEMPKPKYGWKEFNIWLDEESAKVANPDSVFGPVFIEILVDKEGNLTEIEAVKGLNAGLDSNAVEIVKRSPQWVPAFQRGTPVKHRLTFPVYFLDLSQQDEIEHVVFAMSSAPSPKEGYREFYSWIEAESAKVENHDSVYGRVFVQFFVNKKGYLKELKVVRGLNSELDSNAIAILGKSPPWLPGMQGENPVKVRMTIPVDFKDPRSESSEASRKSNRHGNKKSRN